MKVGLTYDLRKEYLARGHSEEDVAEFDSEETVNALDATIRSLGHVTDRIGSAQSLCERLARGDRWDLVFNIAEGLGGRFRESQVPCLLELYGIPYTFSDPFACAITLDKSMAKRVVRDAGVRTPAFAIVRHSDDLVTIRLNYPLFAKPLAEGTGKGVDDRSRLDTPEQLAEVCRHLLARYAQPVLVEEFLPGREFTVGIVGNGINARAIGTMEIEILNVAAPGIYSYENKERCEELVRYSYPGPGELRERLHDLALRAYRALECRDTSRVDIRLDRQGEPAFLEINPLPGLHPQHSDLPMIATSAGISYTELIASMIDSAVSRIPPVP